MSKQKTPKLVIDQMESTDLDRCYLRVNRTYDIRLTKTADGLRVDVWPWGSIDDPIGSLQFFDADLPQDEGLTP